MARPSLLIFISTNILCLWHMNLINGCNSYPALVSLYFFNPSLTPMRFSGQVLPFVPQGDAANKCDPSAALRVNCHASPD